MRFVIVPAPTPPAISPSPAVAASVSPSASLGSPSPAPVVVVDDPGPDVFDYAGLGFTVAASLASLLLAVWAIRIGRAANREASAARAAVATERRRTFELEVLRDLAAVLDEQRQIVVEIAEAPRSIRRHFGTRLALLGEDDLPLWRGLDEYSAAELVKVVGPPTSTDTARLELPGAYVPSDGLIARLTTALREDLLDAIKRRMDARD